jgi:hypothetical protein
MVNVRIPYWVREEEIRVSSGEKKFSFTFMPNRYIELKGLKMGDLVRIEYPLKQDNTVEKVSGQIYNVRWRGDTVVSVQPLGQIYPIFQRSWMEKEIAPVVDGNTYQKQLGGTVHW